MANVYYTIKKNDTLSKIAKGVKVDGKTYKASVNDLAAWNKIQNKNFIHEGDKLIVGTTDGKSVKTSSTASNKNSNSNKVKIDKCDFLAKDPNTVFVTWKWDKDHTQEYRLIWQYHTGDGVWFTKQDHTVKTKNDTCSIDSIMKKIRVKIKPIAKTHKVKTGSGKKQKEKDVEWWTADWCSYKELTISKKESPQPPPEINIATLNNLKLEVGITNIPSTVYATDIQFQLLKRKKKDNGAGYELVQVTRKSAKIDNNHMASTFFDLAVDNKYKVRARSSKGNEYSDWGNYEPDGDSWHVTKPSGIEFEFIKRVDDDEVQCHWLGEKSTAESFEIEYTMDIKYFNSNTDKVTKIESADSREYLEITGFRDKIQQPGGAGFYYFRIRGKIGNEYGPWSGDVNKPETFILGKSKLALGIKPGIPTTWSNAQTAYAGDKINFYWLHNSMDGSSEKNAKLFLKLIPTDGDPVIEQVITIPNNRPEDLKDSPGVYILDTSVGACSADGSQILIPANKFKEDTKIMWYVETSNIVDEWSDQSTTREVQLYEKPYVNAYVTDKDGDIVETVTQFPFYISAQAGPNTQTPIGYHFTVRAKTGYTTTDEVGEEKIISKDDIIYSKYFDPSRDQGADVNFPRNVVLEMLPNNIDLENNIEYEVECVVSMDNGLVATNTTNFMVSFEDDESYMPSAEIIINPIDYSAQIRPICEIKKLVHKKVEIINNIYTLVDEIIDVGWDENHENNGDLINSAYVGHEVVIPIEEVEEEEEEVVVEEDDEEDEDGEIDLNSLVMVFFIENNGETIMYAEVEDEPELVENITLGVYRKEFDGTFTEIGIGISNDGQSISDPHPSLDWARYRITVTKNDTGAISYADTMVEVSGSRNFLYEDRFPGIIIQWDEAWNNFKISDISDADQPDQPAYSGSILKLPYNVDISDSNSKDIELIEYIGRNHPVSYFGTQIGQTSNWNFDIEADDEETLYGLRRLARWMGNVYVRESSGTGYNAVVSLNINQSHNSPIIPVSMSVTRVEGGK